MLLYKLPEIRWLLCCLIFFLCSCSSRNPAIKNRTADVDSLVTVDYIYNAYLQVATAARQIETGDIITRTGNDFTSEGLRLLNQRDKTYSHCGIACLENDSIFVYHALGGEWNPDGKLRRDLLSVFADPLSNKRLGVFTFHPSGLKKTALKETVQELHHRGIPFDMDFDLNTDEKMYCAEFVYKSLRSAWGDSMNIHPSELKQFKFIGVDDIILHPACNRKVEIVYKKQNTVKEYN